MCAGMTSSSKPVTRHFAAGDLTADRSDGPAYEPVVANLCAHAQADGRFQGASAGAARVQQPVHPWCCLGGEGDQCVHEPGHSHAVEILGLRQGTGDAAGVTSRSTWKDSHMPAINVLDSAMYYEDTGLAPDLIGMGRSGKPDIPFKFTDHARTLLHQRDRSHPPAPRWRCAGDPADRFQDRADVPGLDQEEFQDHAERAKTSCIISRALAGVGQINLSATLAP